MPMSDYNTRSAASDDYGSRTVQRLMIQEWMARAECANHDPEIFFPPGPSAHHHIARARSICRTCPVVIECRAAVMADPRIAGIWGGTTESERSTLRSRRPEVAGSSPYARVHVDLRPGGPGAQTAGRA